ncbi:hypothetical protein PACTADRAFT_48926 [Pachysolen tannophilus NRRL Y-2460]|uniref:Uncharacterized protein n=1 Tax=Pachysolen tannophilus NRRL Y-2460 TaxID=669874 RepID=A0A1E4TZL5_PACTA|nr:hypothetical protein PACTADRAFT_48926 [Pachysolen tannophilus NRRL Y-2460]
MVFYYQRSTKLPPSSRLTEKIHLSSQSPLIPGAAKNLTQFSNSCSCENLLSKQSVTPL